MGAATKEFEDALAGYLELDAGQALMSTNSCTAALNCACLLAGAGPGTEVIAPSFTYVAAHQAITATGADVVFCDIEEPTLTVNPDALAELITERTRAIMVCHFAGLVGRLDEIYQVAAEHGVRVVEDAARHRHPPPGRMVGATGDLVCFSFGPVKTMTTLEGGAVVTPGPDELEVLHQYRMLGVDRETEARYRTSAPGSTTCSARGSATTWGPSRPRSAWPSCRCWTSSSATASTTAAATTSAWPASPR